MKAHVFPGQGSQFSGMGKELYENYSIAKEMFQKANDILGFDISKIMFEGTNYDLKQTKVTQPAIFIYSTILAKINEKQKPEMVAGHSLGELSALVANHVLKFEDALILVSKRALAMQKACENEKSTMAAILGLEDVIIESVCEKIDEIVVVANYNCPKQLVISGTFHAVEKACELLKKAGAKRTILLPVSGAFHSPLMNLAKEELKEAINNVTFYEAICPIYQNVDALPTTDINEIKIKLISQLTAPVRWIQTVQNMIKNGCTTFFEIGPGKVLQGLIKKIDSFVEINSI